MEEIKEYIVTLVSMLMIITAIELIAPDNSMKKYIKFVMGLILISIMIIPVISLVTTDVTSFSNKLESYLSIESYSEYSQKEDSNLAAKEMFKKNLEDNCQILLEEKFGDLKFELDIECNLDSKNITYNITKIKAYVSEKGTKKIEKIIINKEDENVDNDIENKDEIVNYLSETLKISKDKIEIYN